MIPLFLGELLPFLIVGGIIAVILLIVFAKSDSQPKDNRPPHSGSVRPPRPPQVRPPEVYRKPPEADTPERQAGQKAERAATAYFRRVLHPDDIMLTNVPITYGDRHTELDNVIVNRKGVFIIEVKYYTGTLVGKEDEHEWTKYRTSNAGNIYEKTVRNPIPQLKREIYLLSRYLNTGNVSVWIEGRVFFTQGNSPVQSQYLLNSSRELDALIHGPVRNQIDPQTVQRIVTLLSESA